MNVPQQNFDFILEQSLHIFLVNLGVSFGFLPRPGKVSVILLFLNFFTIDCTVNRGMSEHLEMVP